MPNKNKSNISYTLLTYIDEAPHRNFIMLFTTEDDAIKYVLEKKNIFLKNLKKEN